MKALERASLRIIHVEDDPIFVELSGVYLKRAGFCHPVTHCPNGKVAVERLFRGGDRSSLPHAVLLDLQIPGMDGIEVLRRIRQKYEKSDLAVFMLTSSSESKDIWTAAANGATSYLVKTGSFMAVIESLDYLIDEINQRGKTNRAASGSTWPADGGDRTFVEF